MANLIAIDWDSHELRTVVARTSSGAITVTDTATVPLPQGDAPAAVAAALETLLSQLGVNKSKYKLLVAIGRGKAELRQLTLPPVPEEELPEMVRFQALQSFSTAGDSVAVDYLPVQSNATATAVIAAGVAPGTMKQIQQVADAIGVPLKRVVLRPVAAAALYRLKATDTAGEGDCVLVDLLADDAEIVVFRGGRLLFVRSVRMPEPTQGRASLVAGEIRRSLMACGTDAATGAQRVVVWGQAETHREDTEQLRELLRCDVQTLDPLTLVNHDAKRSGERAGAYAAGQHTGRLAPLVGALAADAAAEATNDQSADLVDFLNPRKAPEVHSDNRRWIAAGVAVAALLLLAIGSAWWSLRAKTAEIEQRQTALNELRPQVTEAEKSIARTASIDQFLDSSVVWLDQVRRLATQMPPSDRAIVKRLNAVSLPREGGGRIIISGAATSTTAVDEMESALRDDIHSVSGSGTSDLGAGETYRWDFSQTLIVPPQAIRQQRYEAFSPSDDPPTDSGDEAEADGDSDGGESESPESAEPDLAEPDLAEPAPAASSEPPAFTAEPSDASNDEANNSPSEQPNDAPSDVTSEQPNAAASDVTSEQPEPAADAEEQDQAQAPSAELEVTQ